MFPREVDVVMKYLKEHCGAKNIGVIGFCWGGAAVQHLMLKNPHLKTGVSLYGKCQMAAVLWEDIFRAGSCPVGALL